MKTKFMIIAILMLGISNCAHSAISVEHSTSPEYLKNCGYSDILTDHVTVSKYRANGIEYYTKDEQEFANENAFVRFLRKLYIYTDPASETYSIYHHDTKPSPHYTDL